MVQLDVLRREGPEQAPYWQSFSYEPQSPGDTVATALMEINEREGLRDINGKPARPIRWEHSCHQRKCGACAMVICGRPRLACDARLSDYKGCIRLEPLGKFPVAADLIVDRSAMLETLKGLKVWLEAEPERSGGETAYEASRCLQCGLCLEVCPNFYAGGPFAGAAAAAPMSRILAELSQPRKREIARQYRAGVYDGCGKSLACHNICPAEIDLEQLMTRSAGAAVWKRLMKKDEEQ